MAQHASAQQHSASFTSRQRTIALVTVALAFVMDLLDNTIVNVAIPTIQTNLHASYASIQWLIAGYALSFALLLITGGRMGDVFGYKKMFMIGVAGFTLASLLSGLAVNSGMLIAARLFQGAMAALMVPQVMSVMQVMYKPDERAGVNGLFGALGGLAASLGPVVGGLLIKANIGGLDWRPIFLINVPVGIFALIAAQKYLPAGKSPHPLKLDLIGTGLVIVAMTLLIYPLIQGREAGWPTWTFTMLLASLPVFYVFARWQVIKMKRDGSPLVVPHLFRNKSFSAGLLINLIFEAAMLGFFLTFTLVLQIGLGFSAIHAALTGLPVAFGIALTMGIAGQKVIPRIGRRAIVVGTIIMALGLIVTSLVLRRYTLAVHSWQLIPGLLLVGIGMGFVFASLFAAVLSGVNVKHAGSASGLLNAVQQVGGAIGIALIGVIFFGQITSAASPSFDAIAPQLKASLAAQQLPADAQKYISNRVKECYVDRSSQKDASVVPASCQFSSSLQHAPTVGKTITDAVEQANIRTFNHAFRLGTIYEIGLLAVVFGLSFLLPKHIRPEAYQDMA